jgi:hypothetical protein
MPFGRETLPPDDKLACGLSRQLIQLFISDARQDIPIRYMDTFLMVACDEGKSVPEYAGVAQVSNSIMYRCILDISDYARTDEPGLGWVASRRTPNELRKHEILLTAKGHSLAARVRELVDLWTSTKRGG